jgi:hypothetical protein
MTTRSDFANMSSYANEGRRYAGADAVFINAAMMTPSVFI